MGSVASGQANASIPGVACRSLNRRHPCPSCASQKSHAKDGLYQAPQHCAHRASLLARDGPAKGDVLVPRRRFLVLVVVVDKAMAASSPAAESACLVRRRSCLGRHIHTPQLPSPSVCMSSDWELGEATTQPRLRRSFRDMRLTGSFLPSLPVRSFQLNLVVGTAASLACSLAAPLSHPSITPPLSPSARSLARLNIVPSAEHGQCSLLVFLES